MSSDVSQSLSVMGLSALKTRGEATSDMTCETRDKDFVVSWSQKTTINLHACSWRAERDISFATVRVFNSDHSSMSYTFIPASIVHTTTATLPAYKMHIYWPHATDGKSSIGPHPLSESNSIRRRVDFYDVRWAEAQSLNHANLVNCPLGARMSYSATPIACYGLEASEEMVRTLGCK